MLFLGGKAYRTAAKTIQIFINPIYIDQNRCPLVCHVASGLAYMPKDALQSHVNSSSSSLFQVARPAGHLHLATAAVKVTKARAKVKVEPPSTSSPPPAPRAIPRPAPRKAPSSAAQ